MLVFKKIVFLLLLLSVTTFFAQGDGPRAHLYAPTGVWAVNVKYLNLNQNLTPANNLLVKNSNININVFPTTFVHNFEISGKFARVYVMVNPGVINAKIKTDSSTEKINASGFSDGYIAFEYGLIGAPALNLLEFSKHQPTISLHSVFKYWYSGTYDSSKLINLGTNRSAFEIGGVLAVPFHKKTSENMTWLEIMPTVQFYTNNNHPTILSSSNQITQKPLLIIENHLTHNFTKKLWAGVDLRYHYGGLTKSDAISNDNLINMLGGGLNIGYQVSAPFSFFAGYDTILYGDNGAKTNMFRLSFIYSYVNLKKLKQKN